jgi:hypothetical protein
MECNPNKLKEIEEVNKLQSKDKRTWYLNHKRNQYLKLKKTVNIYLIKIKEKMGVTKLKMELEMFNWLILKTISNQSNKWIFQSK